MRQTTVFIICLCFAIGFRVNAEKPGPLKINWETNYAKAQELRESEKRPMLVFISSQGCAYCKKMEMQSFANPSVIRSATEFVPTYVNASKHVELAKAFKVKIYPTTIMVDANNRIVDRIDGFISPEQLTLRLDKARTQLIVAKR